MLDVEKLSEKENNICKVDENSLNMGSIDINNKEKSPDKVPLIENEIKLEKSMSGLDDDKPQEYEKILTKFTKIELMKKSFKFWTKSWKRQIYNQLNTFIANYSSLYLPYIHGKIIDAISNEQEYKNLTYYFELYFIFLFLRYVISLAMEGIYFSFWAQDYDSVTLLENILNKDFEFFDYFKTGELIKRIENSSNTLNMNFIFSFFRYFQTFITLIFSIFMIFEYSIELSLTYITITIIIQLLSYLSSNNDRFHWNPYKYRDEDRYANYLNEIIANIRMIKSFSTETKELEKLKKSRSKVVYKTEIDLRYFIQQILSFFKEFSSIILLFMAGRSALNGKMSFGSFTSFLSYTRRLNNDIMTLKHALSQFRNMFCGWQRFFEIYDYEPKITSNKGEKIENLKGSIEFWEVTFKYPTKSEVYVLEKLNMKIAASQVIAIVGSSGSGKSTISALIQRFYDPTEGKILLDGIELTKIDPNWLHSQIGFVQQEPVLYSGSIESNITYAVESYTKEELDHISKLANAYNFIHDKNQFPKGYNTIVGERGIKLSGGQKQRVAIARALMRKSKILIFDEATSALDAENEHEVQEAIENVIKSGSITTIIIAHRLSTVKNAQKIYVIEKGRIIEEGNHLDLLKLNGAYKKLVHRQLVGNCLLEERSPIL